MKNRLPVFVIVALLALTLGCSDDDDPVPGTAELRTLHFDPALGPIDVDVNGTRVLDDVAYGHSATVGALPAGDANIVIRSGGAEVMEILMNLSPIGLTSLVVTADGPQVPDVVPDTGSVAPDRANLRLIIIVGSNHDEPTQLEAKLTAPAPDSVMTFGIDATLGRYWSLMYFDPGAFTIKFQPAGSSVVLAETAFSIAAGETKAVVLTRADDGTYSASVAVED